MNITLPNAKPAKDSRVIIADADIAMYNGIWLVQESKIIENVLTLTLLRDTLTTTIPKELKERIYA